MKRRDFIKVTGLSVAGAATVAAPAIAQSMPELKWRLTTSWPKSLDTLHGGAELMAKAVGEAAHPDANIILAPTSTTSSTTRSG